jgi:hypothetical protein
MYDHHGGFFGSDVTLAMLAPESDATAATSAESF